MFLINNASKYQDSAMYPHPLTDDTSYPHCNKLRNKLVSQINTEKLTENRLCLTCKTIQFPIRHHNKIDHLRASVYCLRDLRLEDVCRQKNVCITFLVVTTKTWTLAITKGLTDRVSRSPKDPIFSFRANKCHFFSVAQGRTTFKLLMAL